MIEAEKAQLEEMRSILAKQEVRERERERERKREREVKAIETEKNNRQK